MGGTAINPPSLLPGEVYKLTAGDQIAVSVRDHPELSLAETVRSDGKIEYPLLAMLTVAGKTIDQVRAEITRGLSAYIRGPDVTVVVVAYHPENVFVVGNVRTFGPFAYVQGMSAQEALNLAGGPDIDADMQRVNIIRDHKVIAVLDFTSAAPHPFPLQWNDTVYVPKRVTETITVVGAVGHPGTQVLLPKERLLDALTSAANGGGIPSAATIGLGGSGAASLSAGAWQDADLAHITLTRGKEVRTVDGQALMNNKMDENILLEPGDVIYVPSAPRITVVGAVSKPGPQTLSPNERILDAVTSAGMSQAAGGTGSGSEMQGLTPDLSHTALSRDGKTTIVDVAAIMNGDMHDNILLLPDDVVTVPNAPRITVVGNVQRPGTQILAPGEKILDAVTAAGIVQAGSTSAGSGSGDQQAGPPDLAHATLSRNGKVQTVDLAAVLTRGDTSQNIPLDAGDVIFIPGASQITVVGAVQTPGTQVLLPDERVLNAVTLAGIAQAASTATMVAASGSSTVPQGNIPDLAHTILTRAGKTTTIDMSAVLKGSMDDNVLLQPGDVVYVPNQQGSITVLGEVLHPQTTRLLPGERLLDLLNIAGGLTLQAAHASLKHLDGSSVVVNLEELYQGDQSRNILLQDGDVLAVPVNPLQVAVLGAVGKPGVYQFKPGSDVMDALLLAGGPNGQAESKKVSLLRFGKDHQAQQFPINVQQMMAKADFKTDQKLSPGDVVFVPSKGQPSQTLTSILGYSVALLPFARLFGLP
jgi:polysaccharide export outer membrane protein